MKILVYFLATVLLICNMNEAEQCPSKILYPIKTNNGWGYIDCNGTVKIEPKYSSANFMINDVSLVSKRDTIILLNRTGDEIKKFLIEEPWPADFDGKSLRIEHHDSVFFYDLAGDEFLALSRTPYFNISGFFSCNRLLLSSANVFCYIDSQGETKAKFKKGIPSSFDEESGLAAIFYKNKTCFIDTAGEIKFCFKDEDCNEFSYGLALIQNKNEKFFIDKFGKKVIDVSQYDEAFSFVGEMAEIRKAGKGGFIDKTGKEVIPPIYNRVDFFYSGVVAVQPTREKKFYFIDQNNRKIIEEPSDYVESPGFVGDLAWVKKAEKKGWINKKGEFVWIEDNE